MNCIFVLLLLSCCGNNSRSQTRRERACEESCEAICEDMYDRGSECGCQEQIVSPLRTEFSSYHYAECNDRSNDRRGDSCGCDSCGCNS